MSPETQDSELPATAGSEERRASFASKQRSSSTGSRSSSRSTSFHLPDEDRIRLRRKNAEGSEAVDGEDDELDPEGESQYFPCSLLKPLGPVRAQGPVPLYTHQSWMYTRAFLLVFLVPRGMSRRRRAV